MDNTYTIKKKFTALDFEEGNLVYDATHDAMLKVAYIGKRRVQSKTILQIIFEDTANGMLIRVEALDEKGTLPKDKKGNKQFKHLIKIKVSNPITIPYWIYPQCPRRNYWSTPVNPPTYPWYDFWYNTQTGDNLSLMDRAGTGWISTTSNLGDITKTGSTGSNSVLSTVDGNTSTWTTSTSSGLSDISNNTITNTATAYNDQTQQDQATTQKFWNMFGFGYDEEKEEYKGKF